MEDELEDDRLFAALYPGLRRFAAAVVPLGVEPDDVVQEVVARVLRRGHLSELEDPGTYLRRAILNLARNEHRDRTRRAGILARQPSPTSGVLDIYPSDFVDLSRLTVEQRAVLFLRYVEQRDTREIGELLGLGADAVRARASRALKALRLDVEEGRTSDGHRR